LKKIDYRNPPNNDTFLHPAMQAYINGFGDYETAKNFIMNKNKENDTVASFIKNPKFSSFDTTVTNGYDPLKHLDEFENVALHNEFSQGGGKMRTQTKRYHRSRKSSSRPRRKSSSRPRRKSTKRPIHRRHRRTSRK
jgi:hypothetical protein